MKITPKAKKSLKKVKKQGFMARKDSNILTSRRKKGRKALVK
mgnify:CR=1 FL=1